MHVAYKTFLFYDGTDVFCFTELNEVLLLTLNNVKCELILNN